ncbi:MAG: type II secretion system protein, partial [Phenylobacterium sp.]
MKGFTLVEMLVALFIFSLLAAAGVTVMRFTVDNQVAVRGRMDRLG